MLGTKVIHVISFDANLVDIANRFLDLMEVDLVKLPKLAADLKESMDSLEAAINQNNQSLKEK